MYDLYASNRIFCVVFLLFFFLAILQFFDRQFMAETRQNDDVW